MKSIAPLSDSLSDFINHNINEDVSSLALKYAGKKNNFDLDFALIQIEARKKTRKKLSKFITGKHTALVFPSVLSAEQATHQCVSAFHASLIGTSKSVADLTAGLAIDALTFALNGNEVTAVELDELRFEALKYNSELLKEAITCSGGSITALHGDGIQWISQQTKFDCIYIDPARRDGANNRVFKLKDCLPDVVTNYRNLLSKTDKLIIKGSPLLDIKQTLEELPDTTELIITCLNGECKEVLIISDKNQNYSFSEYPKIRAVDLQDMQDGSVKIESDWSCNADEVGKPGTTIEICNLDVGMYLYDPNVALHKIRAGYKLCRDYEGLFQLSRNTDLYVSKNLIPDFPGRIFNIESIPSKKELKKLHHQPVEAISRNYPLSASDIKRKYGIGSGSLDFLIGVRVGGTESPALLLCRKIEKNNLE